VTEPKPELQVDAVATTRSTCAEGREGVKVAAMVILVMIPHATPVLILLVSLVLVRQALTLGILRYWMHKIQKYCSFVIAHYQLILTETNNFICNSVTASNSTTNMPNWPISNHVIVWFFIFRNFEIIYWTKYLSFLSV